VLERAQNLEHRTAADLERLGKAQFVDVLSGRDHAVQNPLFNAAADRAVQMPVRGPK